MEDPNGVSDAVKIFMFPDLFLSSRIDSALVMQKWDTLLESNTLTSYAYTAAIMTKQHISPIFVWEGADKMIEQWIVLLGVILGPQDLRPVIHELTVFVEAGEEVSTRLCAQTHHQMYMLVVLIQIVQR